MCERVSVYVGVVGGGRGFGLLCQEGGVNGCLGGVMDTKPDSTGSGALAERANVCTNVKCPCPAYGRRAGDFRKAGEFPRAQSGVLDTHRPQKESIQPLRRNNHVQYIKKYTDVQQRQIPKEKKWLASKSLDIFKLCQSHVGLIKSFIVKSEGS